MIKSMTGYGQSRYADKDTEIAIQIKSVNHRFLEVSFKSSEIKSDIEEYFKKIILSTKVLSRFMPSHIRFNEF